MDNIAAQLPVVNREAAATMWAEYAATCAQEPGTYSVEYFGDGPSLADELMAQVIHGGKRATSSLENEYLAEGEPLPVVGSHWIACDSTGNPRIIMRTSQVRLLAFDEVDADFAFAEGEDDRSLGSWRREHQKFWQRTQLADFGTRWNPEITSQPGQRIVCERFDVVWPSTLES